MIELEEVNLTVDELEAIRLTDLQGLDQIKAAEQMGISQPTIHRSLDSAHRKVADALVNGKAIRVEGGEYVMIEEKRKFKCYACRNIWDEPYGTGRPSKCPKCNSTNIYRVPEDQGHMRRSRRSQCT